MSQDEGELEFAQLIMERTKRLTFPIEGHQTTYGTAFLYNELVSGPDEEEELVRTWLVTAAAVAQSTTGSMSLRPSCIDGTASDQMVFPQFGAEWVRGGGVAIQGFSSFHDHAARKGWSWNTQEVTAGMLPTEEELSELPGRPVFIVGHAVVSRSQRNDGGLVAHLSGTASELVIGAQLPQGFLGAPVFTLLKHPDGFVLRCLGLVLPGRKQHAIAPISAVHQLVTKTVAKHSQPPRQRGLLRRKPRDG